MGRREQIDQLIDTVYETATSAAEECVWCGLLPGFCSTFGATAGGLIAHDFASGTAALQHGYGIESRCRGHREGDAAGPAVMSPGLSHYREGAVFVGNDAASGDDLGGSEFRQSGPGSFSRLCGMITRRQGKGYLISLMRPAEAEPFDDDDQEVLTRLLPHLKRSLRLRDELAHRRFERESLVDLMDQLPVAVLLVSQSGLVRLRNHAADDLLSQRDAICLRSGYLAGKTAYATAELRRLIAHAASRSAGCEETSSGEHLVIPRDQDRLPLISVAYPSRAADGADGRSEPMAVLLIKDPEIDNAHSLADFIKVYDLTRAEARLLRFLSEGGGLLEAARQLAVTKNTARTHMRSIYAKVGTHRQSDLIRLLHRFMLF